MVSLNAEITINTSPEVVRKTLLDFESHSKWNPFFVLFKVVGNGDVKPGTGLDIDMKLKGDKKPTNMKPTVLVNSAEEFRWKGKLFFDVLFSGEHYFQFKPVDSGKSTQLIQGENFGGVLVPVLNLIGLFDKTKQSFEDLNAALKTEAESRAT